ncbi:inverse autotransporter beta domain-containing protein [Pararhizobium sp.]|uniref:inverse autotransporter beta domain-containing protein n=1 Tax=Pararhizobium sp. TaxID=1977563 RepID=UPI00272389E4|nr:inverse autotransporter beta domain-containing protein [Pararhizobium sp.]MDO9417419.1 inverse autotransporter beta domain-containing protein [Pararhizobium sp.]
MMTMKKGRAVTAVALLISAPIANPVFASDFDNRWGASVDVGGRVGSGREIGETSLFAPLWQNDTSLLFTDLRGSFDDSQAREGNFGLGFRHMLDSGWNIGAYGYFDVRRSALGNTFHQATVGLEALSENLDFRANVYLPVGDTDKTLETGRQSVTSISGQKLILNGSRLTIEGIATTRTITSTVTEKAMKGVDAEIGLRLPVLPDDWNVDLRAFAGGYHFEADGVRNISGPRGRLELSARDVAGLPGVRLTAGVTYQHDQMRGSQWITGARLTVPLHAPSNVNELPPLTTMQQRMTDSVVRDIDIVSDGSTTEFSIITTQAPSTEPVMEGFYDQVITSVTYVDATEGAAALNAALSGSPGSLVVLNGQLHGISEPIIVGERNILVGGDTIMRLRGITSGFEFLYHTTGVIGSIAGNPGTLVDGYNVLAAVRSGSVLGNLTLAKTGTTGGAFAATVYAGNVDRALIISNTISGGDDLAAYGIYVENSQAVEIYDNLITMGANDFTIALGNFGSSTTVDGNEISTNSAITSVMGTENGDMLFSNNLIHPHPEGTIIEGLGTAEFLPGSTGNTIVFPAGYIGTTCNSNGLATGTVFFTNVAPETESCVFP